MLLNSRPTALDVQKNALTRRSETTTLSDLTAKLLAVLASTGTKRVGNEQIAREVWAQSFVSTDTIKQRVKLARDALREIGYEGELENVRGQGYRLTHPIRLAGTTSLRTSWHKIGAFCLVAVTLFVAGLWSLLRVEDTPITRLPALVILPLEVNAPRIASREEAISSTLTRMSSQLSGVRIIAPSAAQDLVDLPPGAIASLHGDAVIIEGSLSELDQVLGLEIRIVDAREQIVLAAFDFALVDDPAQDERIARYVLRTAHRFATALHFQDATDLQDSAARAQLLAALTEMNFGSRDALARAELHLKSALQIAPDFALAEIRLVEVEARQAMRFAVPGKASSALERAQALESRYPARVDVYYVLGLAHLANGSEDEARSYLERARERLPFADRDLLAATARVEQPSGTR